MVRWHTYPLLTVLDLASLAAAETRLDPTPAPDIATTIEALAPISGLRLPVVLGDFGLAYDLTWNAADASFRVSRDGQVLPAATSIDDAGRIGFVVIEADRIIHGAVEAWQVDGSGSIRLALTIAPNDGHVIRLVGIATPIRDDVGPAPLHTPPFEPGSIRYRVVWDVGEVCVWRGAENPTACTDPQCRQNARCGNPPTGHCMYTNRSCSALGAMQGGILTLPILAGWMSARPRRSRC